MARAKEVSWFNLVGGLLLGATAQPHFCGGLAHAATHLYAVGDAYVKGKKKR